jgi:hypothetical protein
MSMAHKLALAATALTLTVGLAATAVSAEASTSAATTTRPSISAASFTGYYGTGAPASPTVTLTGTNFGTTAPAGTSDNTTSCGTYTANGQVYGSELYVVDDNNFEAGYSTVNSADCIGISVVSWSNTQVVLKFGNAYGTFAHWYLSNGDGYALSVNGAIFGGTVSGLL